MTAKRKKMSVHLEGDQVRARTSLAKQRGNRDFALARGFSRSHADPRPISEISDAELLEGFATGGVSRV